MLYIITAVHNRCEITKKFIDNLKASTYKNYRLLLVDDGSTDGTEAMVSQALPSSIVLRGDGNLWWGGALHKAYKFVTSGSVMDCSAVLYINDDTRFPENFLETGMELLNKHPDSLIAGCGYNISDGRMIDAAVNYNRKNGDATFLPPGSKGNCASTRALLMTFDVYKKIGGFHPVLLPQYGSDYEYTLRASKKGFDILSFPAFRYDFDEGTTGYNRLKGIKLKQLFSKRSRFNPVYRLVLMFMVTPPLYYIPSFFGSVRRMRQGERE